MATRRGLIFRNHGVIEMSQPGLWQNTASAELPKPAWCSCPAVTVWLIRETPDWPATVRPQPPPAGPELPASSICWKHGLILVSQLLSEAEPWKNSLNGLQVSRNSQVSRRWVVGRAWQAGVGGSLGLVPTGPCSDVSSWPVCQLRAARLLRL